MCHSVSLHARSRFACAHHNQFPSESALLSKENCPNQFDWIHGQISCTHTRNFNNSPYDSTRALIACCMPHFSLYLLFFTFYLDFDSFHGINKSTDSTIVWHRMTNKPSALDNRNQIFFFFHQNIPNCCGLDFLKLIPDFNAFKWFCIHATKSFLARYISI